MYLYFIFRLLVLNLCVLSRITTNYLIQNVCLSLDVGYPDVRVMASTSPSTLSIIIFPWRNCRSGSGPPHCRGPTITFRYTTVGRTPLDECSARRGDYLTSSNTHKRETSTPPTGFEPAIPASTAADYRLRPHGHSSSLITSSSLYKSCEILNSLCSA